MKHVRTHLIALAAATACVTIAGAAFAEELSIMASGGAWQDVSARPGSSRSPRKPAPRSSSRNISAISAR
ncbi:exported hypothetical protein [Mesorhizobium sp. SOD10]|nr:exported hypothetical protein [Mesorhizobium sp. SOD10]